jgi:hypothetical protein
MQQSDPLKSLQNLFDADHLSPCWLVVGDVKDTRALTYNFASYVLSSPKNNHGLKASLIQHQMDQRTYGNLFVLQKADDANEILIDQLAPLHTFLHRSPLIAGWRVVIIDTIDEMNRFGANSLLKCLEEPPSQTLILLLCRQWGSLLPTIRSRCQKIVVPSSEDMRNEALVKDLHPYVRDASAGNIMPLQRYCEEYTGGDKERYDDLATALFSCLYENSFQEPHYAELWLTFSRFWLDAKKSYLDKAHAFMVMVASLENPAQLKAAM